MTISRSISGAWDFMYYVDYRCGPVIEIWTVQLICLIFHRYSRV